MIKILMITINDPAGTAIAFTRAINKYTEHSCRLITKEIRYNFMYEKDLHLPWLKGDDWDELEDLLKTSDVFHFHMTADENIELGPFKVVDYMKGKQIVHHHHGHPDFRGNPEKYRQKYKRLKRRHLLVSTPDLLKLLPEAHWVPNLVPITDPLYNPARPAKNKRMVIGHSPTRRDLKNTADLVAVSERLNRESASLRVAVDIIENTNHKECMKRKNACHVIFDHMQGYYGVSSLESLSQGKPVIAGLDDWNIQHLKNFSGSDKLPWIIARTPEELEREIEELIADENLCEEIGKESREFMEIRWNERRIVFVLKNYFEKL